MLLHVPDILSPDEIRQARDVLARAPWGSGRITAGEQSAQAKNNEQLPETSQETRELQALVLAGLERHPVFFSATLPKHISPPLFNRYGGTANHFGNHVDSAVRYLRNGAGRVRTDISCTLFLSEPDEYDGGELVIENTGGQPQRIKLPAGHMVIYPGTSVHRVEPVTRGHRLASFFWIQSMVRSNEQRQLLFDMDTHLIRLRSTIGETDASVIGLTGTYHNLLRTWLDV
ncbi:Fe2+-dependent dioxygenase [Polaromonas sp. SM01]|uniref:Fe2+-dependent dioxygenase n=1 Tax=Polaromonas sp. SM01 TaxID=3085630 RepID=UPI0029811913|nr:Fe2+-dependent dioxygenase [Polaromonas sp. SM01]MDW5441951.1 Fe2+-dependent dioxygenase [Polaromonas sp. SM01]